jgi:predicted TIM-barrel fold metal-dependent hydrolase
MTTAVTTRHKVFDADGHIFEDQHEIFEFLPGIYHGRKELLRNPLFPYPEPYNKTAMAIAGRFREGAVSETYREANYEIKARQWLDFLAQAEIEGTVLYPTWALRAAFVKDVAWGTALAHAYNDWMHATFTKDNPHIRAVALLPMQDSEAAARELRRAVTELGAVGGVLVAAQRRRALGDACYDPIYAAAQKLDVPIAIHAGGPGNRFEMFDSAIESRCVGHPTSLVIELTSMMFNGVFDRFPGVRFAFMEGGIAWALFLRERMHEAYEQWAVQAPQLKRDPDDHLAGGQLYFHCEADERILPYAVSVLGENAMLYASDFPHIAPEKIVEEKEKLLARSDLSESAKRKITRENALRLYKLSF